MEEHSNTSPTLIRDAKAQNPDAWRDLVQLYSRRIYRWCRRAGLQPADAGNVVQEVLRSVARKLPDFRHEQASDSFRGWLRRITTNKITDHFRSEGKQPAQPRGGTDAHRQLLHLPSVEIHEPTWATTQSRRGTPLLDPTKLAEVRRKISDRDWKMFWRVVIDGQSAVEVGEEFGVTANTVRIVKMRVLRRLKSHFQESHAEKNLTQDDPGNPDDSPPSIDTARVT